MMKNLSWRVYIALIFTILSLIAIGYNFEREGVAIVFIEKDSLAYESGLSFNPNKKPTQYEIIKYVNGIKIESVEQFYNITKDLMAGDIIPIVTNKKSYLIEIKIDNQTNKTKPLGIVVDEIPRTNLRFGIDISGGTRILLKPEQNITEETLESAKDILANRLDLYGISNIKIRIVKDTENNNYISIEIAGKTIANIIDLVSSTGKFEAKIGNITVFEGGKRDISFIGKSKVQNAGLLAQQCPIKSSENLYLCRFSFPIYLKEEAANNFYNVVKNLSVVNNEYLNETIDLYLDGILVESLFIGKELRERPATQVAVSGFGQGRTVKESQENALKEMKKLQSILETGSLPVKMEIVQIEEVSSKLGKDFLRNILIIAILSILVVSLTIFFRYKDLRISGLIIVSLLFELIIILGVASFIGWNLDLVSLAGLLVVIGSGVDNQIVITDELKSRKNIRLSLKERIINAFFIIFGSYLTTAGAVSVLLFAGGGILRGFAITTLIGTTVGVLITRPAFADLVQKLEKD